MSQPNHQSPDFSGDLKMENDFLKMKLMLEHGATFHSGPGSSGMDPVTENAFLQQVINFEEKSRQGEKIPVFEKLGRPTDIRKMEEISEGELPSAIEEMQERLFRHSIHLTALSPHITPREMYRFMTEEFLEVEMTDYDTPGIYSFVYDEFHPDPYYDNECTALDYCIRLILQKDNLLYVFPPGEPVRLNDHEHLSDPAFLDLINRFKGRYTDIAGLSAEANKTVIKGDTCRVSGTHVTGLCTEDQCQIIRGQWMVEFKQNNEGEWLIYNIQIEGIQF
jgi:hypothetical protein